MILSTESLDDVSTAITISFSKCCSGMLRLRMGLGSHEYNEALSMIRIVEIFITVAFINLDYIFAILGV